MLSIDAHFIVVAHYYSFVCYRNLSFIRTVEWENVRVFSIKTLRPSGSYISIGPATSWFVKKILFTMCTAAVHFGLQFNWRIEVWIIFLINLAWDYPHNELLVTFLVRNRTYEHFFPVYNFIVLHFCTVGDASLLENWIREGDEQGNFPVNAFVFLSIVFGFIIFLEQSYEWMIELTCY